MTPIIKLIYAASLNRVIGKDGQIPWHIPEDLKYFKEHTAGTTVLMGRKTWESIPNRPLIARNNVIVTSNAELAFTDCSARAEGVKILQNPMDVFTNFRPFDKRRPIVWVIGGEKVLEDFMPLASEIHETIVDKIVEGDTFAPIIPQGPDGFKLVSRFPDDTWATSISGERYRSLIWLRKKQPALSALSGDGDGAAADYFRVNKQL